MVLKLLRSTMCSLAEVYLNFKFVRLN